MSRSTSAPRVYTTDWLPPVATSWRRVLQSKPHSTSPSELRSTDAGSVATASTDGARLICEAVRFHLDDRADANLEASYRVGVPNNNTRQRRPGDMPDPRTRLCEMCSIDRAFLLTSVRPKYENSPSPVRIVDLFAGGGGLTLGAAEAALRMGRGTEVALAVENDDRAADVYALNFPRANLARIDIETIFDGRLGDRATASERDVASAAGDVDVLVAGPPCQGHSDLNNHTRRDDPRNSLYLRVARAAEVLRPTLVIIENVPAVRHDRDGVVTASTQALEAAGYSVASSVLDLVRFGVPQRRRRHILLGVYGDRVDPSVLGGMSAPCHAHDARSVRWAIEDLVDHAATSDLDIASRPTPVNMRRMQWLIDWDKYDLPNEMRPRCHHGSHSYNSMYGRLAWDRPAQTITTGFGSMGQGRFVHPAEPRTLTPHEAARLQTLPDFFDLDSRKGRGAWATVIGNAVPPLLGVHLIRPLLTALASGTTR